MAEREHGGLRGFLFSRAGLVLLGFLAIAGYFLWQEHAVHIAGYLPLVLILAVCGGMHFFMHGGHGGHAKDTEQSGRGQASEMDRSRDDRSGGSE